MKTITTLAAALLSGCAAFTPPDNWSRRDTVLQSTAAALATLDAVTTMNLSRVPGMVEKGPVASRIIGPTPSNAEIAGYFAATVAANYLIARALPPRWRPYWQGSVIAMHLGPAAHNCELGACLTSHSPPPAIASPVRPQ
jgi:hypothetical protein